MEGTCFIDLHTHAQHTDSLCVISYEVGSGKPFPDSDFVSAGVHPWDAEKVDMNDAVRFLETAQVAAIGEIGLDFSRDIDRGRQEEVFRAQLEVAARRGLPVILHCVRAHNEILRILPEYHLKAVVFHGYTGSKELTATITGKGYYISLGERSLESDKTIESIRRTDAGFMFAETDTSDIPIEAIYNSIAVIKKVEVTELKTLIYNNFKKIFG